VSRKVQQWAGNMAYSLQKSAVSAPAQDAEVQSVQSLSQEAKFFAHLSSVAYYDPRQRPLRQNEFDLDLEFNTDRFAVYQRGGWLSAKAVVITFRGTSDMSDERNDLLLASNTNVNRLQQLLASEVECIGAVARKYPKARIQVTGHSLGGTIAMFVTVHTGLVVGGHIFNPGAGVKTEELLLGAAAFGPGAVLGFAAASGATACADFFSHKSHSVGKVEDLASRINTHHVLGDPLSLLFSLGNIQCYSPTRANLHALRNFIGENPPSTHSEFDSQAHCKDVSCIGKRVSAPTARARGRSVSLKTEARSHSPHGSCAKRTHSHSSAGGWTEVVGQMNNKTAHSLMKLGKCPTRSVMPLNRRQNDTSTSLHGDHDWMEVLGDTGGAADRSVLDSSCVALDDVNEDWRRALSVAGMAEDSLCIAWNDTKEDWRSALDVGSVVEVFAYAAESQGQGRKWVEAEVVVARPEVLSLKWVAGDGGGDIFRRVARHSAQIRSAGNSAGDHADSHPAGDSSICAPEVQENIEDDLVDVPLSDDSWRSALTVGSMAELRVKRQWILAEVSIARDNSLTMKWIDCQDGAEAYRRVARNTSDLRPCRVKVAPW